MKENNLPHQDWLRKAEEDGIAGEEILTAGKVFAPACFHFQQMAEKYLKALLVSRRTPFSKTHDLIALAALLEPMVMDIKLLKPELELLNRYYIETRYPGDYPEITESETKNARAAAAKIKEFVLRQFNK